MRWGAAGWILALVLVTGACSHGDSSSSPTAPDSSAAVTADILSLTLYGCDASGNNCRYSFALRNTGTGCAGTLQGTIKQTLADGSTSSSSWSVSGLLQPNQTVGVNGCCVTTLKPTGTFSIQPTFQSVRCS